MPVVTEQFLLYGFRGCRIFPLNSSGVPYTTLASGAPYNGVTIEGAVTLDLNVPPPRTIIGFGTDGITQIGTLAPQEAVTGTLSAEAFGDALYAAATGVKSVVIGETTMTPIATDQQGAEPMFMLMAWRLCTGLTTGVDLYQTVFVPACKFIPSYPGFSGDKGATSWSISPRRVAKNPLGVALTRATDGCLRAQAFTATSQNPNNYIVWKGDNVVTEFLFPADYQGILETKSVLYSAGATLGGVWASDGYTPTVKPADGVLLYSLYETPAIAA